MEQYIIKGGIPLVGEVEIAGAKNAALPILSAAIMSDETVTLENLPDVNDINGVDVTINNTSTLPVYFKVVDDDTTSPRFMVANRNGSVKVFK